MPTFTLAGVVYDYLTPKPEGDPEDIHSWEYGHWLRVEAAVPLTAGGSTNVYGQAVRWGHNHILTEPVVLGVGVSVGAAADVGCWSLGVAPQPVASRTSMSGASSRFKVPPIFEMRRGARSTHAVIPGRE